MNYFQPPYTPWLQPIPYQAVPSVDMNPLDQPGQQSYIENILRDNLNKVATVYMNFEGSQWGSKIFKGYVKGAGKDHIILKDLQSETRYILLMVYLDYITFDEVVEYEYPYRGKEKQ